MYMYICHYTHTHIYTVYFDCCSPLYLPDVIFWKAGGGVGWESQATLSFTVVLCGRGRQGAILGSDKSFWKDLHSAFGHCFFFFLQFSERNISYNKLFQ